MIMHTFTTIEIIPKNIIHSYEWSNELQAIKEPEKK